MFRVLPVSDRLRVWERGLRLTSAQRALLLLAAAAPGISPDELAQLTVGRRDSLLLTQREWMFGPRIDGVTACPDCRQELELTFDLNDIRGQRSEDTASKAETYLLQVDGCQVNFRLPNCDDLQAIAPIRDLDEARTYLLSRCIFEIRRDNGGGKAEEDASGLPAEVVEALAEKMSALDSQADVRLNLTCPACRHNWPAIFDIASFLWTEINDWARRTLHEVHLIASAYGWSEADILEMGPERRGIYLEMLDVA